MSLRSGWLKGSSKGFGLAETARIEKVMRFDASLQQRLEQRMILAPRMIQAMEILQLPLMALQERIDQELIANPVLELRGDGSDEGEPAELGEPEVSADSPVAETERELVVRDDGGPRDF